MADISVWVGKVHLHRDLAEKAFANGLVQSVALTIVPPLYNNINTSRGNPRRTLIFNKNTRDNRGVVQLLAQAKVMASRRYSAASVVSFFEGDENCLSEVFCEGSDDDLRMEECTDS